MDIGYWYGYVASAVESSIPVDGFYHDCRIEVKRWISLRGCNTGRKKPTHIDLKSGSDQYGWVMWSRGSIGRNAVMRRLGI